MGGCWKMVKLYGKRGVALAFLHFLFFMLGIGCGKTVEFFSRKGAETQRRGKVFRETVVACGKRVGACGWGGS